MLVLLLQQQKMGRGKKRDIDALDKDPLTGNWRGGWPEREREREREGHGGSASQAGTSIWYIHLQVRVHLDMMIG